MTPSRSPSEHELLDSLARVSAALARTNAGSLVAQRAAWSGPSAAGGVLLVSGAALVGVAALAGWWLLVPAAALGAVGASLLAWRRPANAGPKRAHIGMGATVAADARIEPGATVDMGATVRSGAVIRRGARVGMGATIGAGAVLEEDALIGWGATVGPNPAAREKACKRATDFVEAHR